MVDSRGIRRGECVECPEDDRCTQFGLVATTHLCGHCEHGATKHKRIEQDGGIAMILENGVLRQVVACRVLNPVENADDHMEVEQEGDGGQNQDGGGAENVNENRRILRARRSNKAKKGETIPTSKPTGPKSVTQTDFPLPTFSANILKALQGTSEEAHVTKVWLRMIQEAVNHYRAIEVEQRLNIKHPLVYDAIGEKMFMEYPSIKVEGQSPHAAFRKSLGQAMRDRRRADDLRAGFGTEERSRRFEHVRGIFSEKPKRDLDDADVNAASIYDAKSILKEEMAKASPSESRVETNMNKTYGFRSTLVHSGVALSKILEQFPLLLKLHFFEAEAVHFFGKIKYEELKSNVGHFVKAVNHVEQNNEGVHPFIKMQEDWTNNGKVFIFPKNLEEFTSSIKTTDKDFPKIVCWKNIDALRVEICVGGKVISGINTFENGLVALISLYLMFEIPATAKIERLVSIINCYCLGINMNYLPQNLMKHILALLEYVPENE